MIKKCDAYVTTDGTIFLSEGLAVSYDCDYLRKQLDTLLQRWAKNEPRSNYPNCKQSLIQHIMDNAEAFRQILNEVE